MSHEPPNPFAVGDDTWRLTIDPPSSGLSEIEVNGDPEAFARRALPFVALDMAAEAFAGIRRKGMRERPYVNHLIAVMTILVNCGMTEPETLAAAALHDIIEDTPITGERLVEMGIPRRVVTLVLQVTDDKTLPYAARKRAQVAKAPMLFPNAKAIKIADKIANISDLLTDPPPAWDKARKVEYVRWSQDVVAGCRGAWPRLDAGFDDTVLRFRAAEDTL